MQKNARLAEIFRSAVLHLRWESKTRHLPAQSIHGHRRDWIAYLHKLTEPVLAAAVGYRLTSQKVEIARGAEGRARFFALEAVARSLLGLAPWLECETGDPDESALQHIWRDRARLALGNLLTSKDGGDLFAGQRQPLVEAAFLVYAMTLAPRTLWTGLPAEHRARFLDFLVRARKNEIPENNWRLFRGMVSAFLIREGIEVADPQPEHDLEKVLTWYKGDGVYGDGPEFRFDYYNSFVIHPLALSLRDMLWQLGRAEIGEPDMILTRAHRFAEVLERMIGPDGSYPPLGRSIAYRCGAFHHLAGLALRDELPETLPPGQVRAALWAAISRTLDAPGTFDDRGWLRIGLAGRQPELGENYITTGSLYLCTAAFLPLGLPASDPFWTSDAMEWTGRRLWSGQQAPRDFALKA
jgi:hypothetical protein